MLATGGTLGMQVTIHLKVMVTVHHDAWPFLFPLDCKLALQSGLAFFPVDVGTHP